MMSGFFNSFGWFPFWIHLFCVFGWILVTGWLLFMIWAIKFMKKDTMVKVVSWLIGVGIVGGLLVAMLTGNFMAARWGNNGENFPGFYMMRGWNKNPAVETCRANAKSCLEAVTENSEQK